MDYGDLELTMQSFGEIFNMDEMGNLSPSTTLPASPFPMDFCVELEELLSIDVTQPKRPGQAYSTCSSISTQSISDTSTSDIKVPRPRRRVTHKDHVLKLEKEAAKFTIELEEAQARADELALLRATSGEGINKCTKTSCHCQPMWEAIATKQRQYREKTEAQNVHLRKLLELQNRYLRNVRRTIRKQPKRMEMAIAASAITPIHQCELRELDRPNNFDDLCGRLNEMYAQVDLIWESFDIAEKPIPSRKCLTSTEAFRNDAQLEFIARSGLPFGVDTVVDTVWKFLADTCLRQSFVQTAKIIDSYDTTIQVIMDTKHIYNGFEVNNSVRCITLKHVEDSCVTFVTVSATEPVIKGQSEVEGIKVITTTLRVLKHGSGMPDGSRGTIFESYWSTRVFDGDGESKCPTRKLEPFIDFGIEAIEAAITQEHEAIEDLLVQMSIGAR